MKYNLRESTLSIGRKPNGAIETIFANRGIPPDEISHYLHTTDADILDPALIANIQTGAKMLLQHIEKNDKIFIQVDSDCDGFTSAAFLINYLHCLYPSFVENNIAYRVHIGKQHGIIVDTIPDDVQLVIAPDSSSNDYEQHEQLFKKGCDVLVIDHHEAEKISEFACIINNQLCDYPDKNLSGVGMVYKFCCYLDKILNVNYANRFVDLAALGIIGDMMDIRNFEIKRIIDIGLANIQNPFFKQMVKNNNFSIERAGGLCPFSVSFYIVPFINGAIRMGTPEEKLFLFESMLDYNAYKQIPSTKRGGKGQTETVVEQACRLCTNLKRHQGLEVEKTLSLMKKIVEEKHLSDNAIIAILLDSQHSINKNLTGLVANQMVALYNHPVLILNEDVNSNGEKIWLGSGRGYETEGLQNFRAFMLRENYAFLAQGHPNAFGCGIKDKDFNHFIQDSNEILHKYHFEPCTQVDFIWQGCDFSGQDIIAIASLNQIWGQGLESPFVAIKNLHIQPQEVALLSKDKNPTLKITLKNGVSLIKFRSSEEEYNNLTKYPSGSVNINIIGTCKINEWNGIINPQIELKDYDIIEEQEYYF